jgi:hypothetical protein
VQPTTFDNPSLEFAVIMDFAMTVKLSGEITEQPPLPALRYRIALALAVILLVLAYTSGVVSGSVTVERKIDSVNLGIIVLAVFGVLLLLRPSILDSIRHVKFASFELEMLEKVKEKQAKQAIELDEISLVLPLLISDKERKHLLNLGDGTTRPYEGNHSMRTELRRLRSIGLIKMRPYRQVRQMDNGSTFDLSDYVELTDLGKRWVPRIKEIEKADAHDDSNAVS